MAEGPVAPRNPASAMADNSSMISTQRASMDVDPPSGPLRQSQIQPTTNATVHSILSHEMPLAYTSVSAATTRGAILFKQAIDPSKMKNATASTRVSWLSRLYMFWRGGMTFKFVFTKTILQQTKILAVFVPGDDENSVPPSADEAYAYRHKVLMNPANETEWVLDVPYVDSNPFKKMGQSTGMLYVLLFQTLVSSNTESNDIYFSTMVSGEKLEMLEFGQLPALNSTQAIVPSKSFIIHSFTGTNETPANVSMKTFLSDAGRTLASSVGSYNFVTPNVIADGTPVAASELQETSANYDPNLMLTLYGHPRGQASSVRQIAFTQTNVAANTSIGDCVILNVYIWSDLSFAVGPGFIVPTSYALPDIIRIYAPIFPSGMSQSSGVTSQKLRDLESTVKQLLSQLALDNRRN